MRLLYWAVVPGGGVGYDTVGDQEFGMSIRQGSDCGEQVL